VIFLSNIPYIHRVHRVQANPNHTTAFNLCLRRWQAFLTDSNGKQWPLAGEWEREEDAARAYDAEAVKRFGADAELNLQV
jgi:hypothetical protein